MVHRLLLESGNGRCVVRRGEKAPKPVLRRVRKNLGSILETSLTSGSCINKAQGEKKWAAPILDRILQDQSLDHNLVLDQDQDHILERRDTVLGLVPGHIQGLVVEIVFILEIIVEITGIIEE